MCEFEEALKATRDVFVNYPKRYKENLKELDRLHKEEIDLLHIAELKSLNASQGFKLYKELQNVRKRRRKIKDENEILEAVIRVSKKYTVHERAINEALGEVRKANQRHRNRGYRMRVRTDLQDFIDKQSVGS